MSYHCDICFEEKENSLFLQLPCKHSFCKDCICKHISVQLKLFTESESSHKRECPTCPNCRACIDITPEFIRQHQIKSKYFNIMTALVPEHMAEILHRDKVPQMDRQSSLVRSITQKNIPLLTWWMEHHTQYLNALPNLVLEFCWYKTETEIIKIILPAYLKVHTLTTILFLEKRMLEHFSLEIPLPMKLLNGMIENFRKWTDVQISMFLMCVTCKKDITPSVVQLLNWWTENKLKVIENDNISRIENVDVLNWWKTYSKGRFLESLTPTSLNRVTSIETLQLWKTNAKPFLFHRTSIKFAIRSGKMDTVIWWNLSGLPFSITSDVFIDAASSNNLQMFIWIHRNWSSKTVSLLHVLVPLINIACQNNHLMLFIYIVENTVKQEASREFLYDPRIIYMLCESNRYHMLEWLYEQHHVRNIPFSYDESAVEIACQNGHLKIVQFWVYSKFNITFDISCIDAVLRNHHFHLIKWLADTPDYGLPLECSVGMFSSIQRKDLVLMTWLKSPYCVVKLNDIIKHRMLDIEKKIFSGMM